jgi:hypothetical protein
MPSKITLHLQRKPDMIDITIITPSGTVSLASCNVSSL